jgi:osmoprotectant transport system permease protein
MTVADVLGRLLEHCELIVAALVCATVLALPLGVCIVRSRFRDALVGLLAMLYTIPSLALFALFVPVLGLGAPTAVTVLVIYALGIITRAVVVGVLGIDPAVRESALALGFSPRDMILQIELPLARGTILAGVRTAAIVVIGTAMIAAWIDGGGLGALIFTGIRQDDPQRIYVGSGLAALLAISANAAFGRLAAAWRER